MPAPLRAWQRYRNEGADARVRIALRAAGKPLDAVELAYRTSLHRGRLRGALARLTNAGTVTCDVRFITQRAHRKAVFLYSLRQEKP